MIVILVNDVSIQMALITVCKSVLFLAHNGIITFLQELIDYIFLAFLEMFQKNQSVFS